MPTRQSLNSNTLGHTVGEENKSRHSRDPILGSNILNMIRVDLCKRKMTSGSVPVSEGGKDRRNGAAWRAPVGVEIYHDMLV